jgi:hypothetical protein
LKRMPERVFFMLMAGCRMTASAISSLALVM